MRDQRVDMPPIESIDRYDFLGFLSRDQLLEVLYATMKPEFWENISPVFYAQQFVKNLRKEGHEIFFVTQPWRFLDSWCEVRTRWLRKHFNATHDEIVFSANKDMIAGDILYEDSAGNAHAWAHLHPQGTAYLLKRTYNQGLELLSNVTYIEELC
jgi:5'(3')-deoxyribonucleotidase